MFWNVGISTQHTIAQSYIWMIKIHIALEIQSICRCACHQVVFMLLGDIIISSTLFVCRTCQNIRCVCYDSYSQREVRMHKTHCPSRFREQERLANGCGTQICSVRMPSSCFHVIGWHNNVISLICLSDVSRYSVHSWWFLFTERIARAQNPLP